MTRKILSEAGKSASADLVYDADWKDRFPPGLILAGLVIGAIAAFLSRLGNPANMGLCIVCFERDIAGTLGLHRAAGLQYMRPELLGMALGVALAALFCGELQSRSGSSPAVRFLLGIFVAVGALVFMGCPTRMIVRLGGGDWTAVAGLAGFTAGIGAGAALLRNGASLGRSTPDSCGFTALVMPLLAAVGAIFLAAAPSLLFAGGDGTGPGGMRAPLTLSLSAGLIIGVVAQRSRLCFAGGIRDLVLLRSGYQVTGLFAVFAGVLVVNLLLGRYNPGWSGQPFAHSQSGWSFMSMALVGLASVLMGGCPFRQFTLASQGNADSMAAVCGMVAGTAVAHNFGWAATEQGVPAAGVLAVVVGLLVCIAVGLMGREK